MKKLDLTGHVYNYFTVIEEDQNSEKRYKWICKCRCGKIVSVARDKLRSGSTKSCGCRPPDRPNNAIRKREMNPRTASAKSYFDSRYNDGNLTLEQFLELTQKDCFYCGRKPEQMHNKHKSDDKASQFAKDTGDFVYNGLDRIDSTLPHNIENVVPCCKLCNQAKSDMTVAEFKQLIRNIYLTFESKNNGKI